MVKWLLVGSQRKRDIPFWNWQPVILTTTQRSQKAFLLLQSLSNLATSYFCQHMYWYQQHVANYRRESRIGDRTSKTVHDLLRLSFLRTDRTGTVFPSSWSQNNNILILCFFGIASHTVSVGSHELVRCLAWYRNPKGQQSPTNAAVSETLYKLAEQQVNEAPTYIVFLTRAINVSLYEAKSVSLEKVTETWHEEDTGRLVSGDMPSLTMWAFLISESWDGVCGGELSQT